MVIEIEQAAAEGREREPLGIAAIAAQHPHTPMPRRTRTPIPLVHAASVQAWKAFKSAYRAFLAAYRYASAQLRAGSVGLPSREGSFPPPLPFVNHAPLSAEVNRRQKIARSAWFSGGVCSAGTSRAGGFEGLQR